jgi:hypothetical protein
MLPTMFVTTTVYIPLSAVLTLVSTSDVLVAPLIAVLFFRHWNVMGNVPAAATENVTVPPSKPIWLCGWVAIVSVGGVTSPAGRSTGIV